MFYVPRKKYLDFLWTHFTANRPALTVGLRVCSGAGGISFAPVVRLTRSHFCTLLRNAQKRGGFDSLPAQKRNPLLLRTPSGLARGTGDAYRNCVS
jgi:hypothetical protein